MQEKATLYLATGTGEFWVVDAGRGNVTVVRLEGALVYGAGDRIPLSLFEGELDVSEIFG